MRSPQHPEIREPWLQVVGAVSRALPLGRRTASRVLARRGVQKGFHVRRTHAGFLMNLDLGVQHYLHFCLGLYEHSTVRVLGDTVREGALFLDCGANAGYLTLLTRQLVGSTGQVIAYEAEPTIYRLLEENVALNQCHNITLRQTAVGDQEGEAAFVAAGGTACSTLENSSGTVRQESADLRRAAIVHVPMTTLDADCGSLAQEWPGQVVLKLDIEGAEPLALAGASQLLQRMDMAIVEIEPRLLAMHGYRAADVLRFFPAQEFRVLSIPPKGKRLQEVGRDFESPGNVLVIRKAREDGSPGTGRAR